MRLVYYIYISLKQVIKQFPITILYVVGLPLGISLLMGFMMEELFTNPNEVSPLPVLVTDEDQSPMSQQLLDVLASESFQEFLYISLVESAEAELVIPKGYESALLSAKDLELDIIQLSETMNEQKLMTLQMVLNQYHEQLQTSIASSGNLDVVKEIYNTPATTSIYIDTPIQLNSVSFYATSMLGFFVMMMVMTLSAGNYKQDEMGFNKRFYAMPLSRITMFNYDNVFNFIYVFFLFIIYVLVYRSLGYAFTGSFVIVLLGILATTLFIVGLGTFISTFFPAKYGNAIATGLFFIQVALGGSFFPIDTFIYLSPGASISKLFTNIVLYDTFSSIQTPFFITLGIGIFLYVLTLVKIKYRLWEE